MSTDFPSDLCVFERGWLSSNSLLMLGEHATLIDSGHVSHAQQLQALLAHHLGAQNLCTLLNTHLHSDHCGGNAHLKLRYPALNIAIPLGNGRRSTIGP